MCYASITLALRRRYSLLRGLSLIVRCYCLYVTQCYAMLHTYHYAGWACQSDVIAYGVSLPRLCLWKTLYWRLLPWCSSDIMLQRSDDPYTILYIEKKTWHRIFYSRWNGSLMKSPPEILWFHIVMIYSEGFQVGHLCFREAPDSRMVVRQIVG